MCVILEETVTVVDSINDNNTTNTVLYIMIIPSTPPHGDRNNHFD